MMKKILFLWLIVNMLFFSGLGQAGVTLNSENCYFDCLGNPLPINLSNNYSTDCSVTIDNDTQIGVYINQHHGVVIRRCIIEGYNTGIKLSLAPNNNILSNSINTTKGIELSNSFWGNITNNNVSGEIQISNSQEVNIANNTIHGGLSIEGNSQYSVADNNDIFNSSIGIALKTPQLTATNNRIHSVNKGILLYIASYSTVYNNTISNSSESGVYIQFGEKTNISSNNISYNYNGIDIEGSTNNRIYNNNILNNSVTGINILSSGNGNNISTNNISHNLLGIFISGSTNMLIESNNISNNSGFGITVYGHDNTISNNTIRDNNGTNIRVGYDSGSPISRTKIMYNNISGTYYGIYHSIGGESEIIGNNITNNTIGIYIISSTQTRLARNYMCFNSNTDLFSYLSPTYTGTDNQCDTTFGWNDDGSNKCRYNCSEQFPLYEIVQLTIGWNLISLPLSI